MRMRMYCFVCMYVAMYACVHACVYSTHDIFHYKVTYKHWQIFLTANFRPVSEICVTSFSISWEISNDIRCGDISYEVSISPPPIEGDAVTTTENTFYNVTGLNNSLPNVTITVNARS